MKSALAMGVLLAALTPGVASEKPTLNVVIQPGAENTIVHEPLLVYELVGSSQLAQIDLTLYVYADGWIKLAQADADSLGFSRRALATPRTVQALKNALMQAGAMKLFDDARTVTDVPLHTLTMMQGAQDARAHTFSYWVGDGEYAVIDALLEEFIVEQFP